MPRKTVLIADDDETTRFVLSEALLELGHDPSPVADGCDVSDCLVAKRYDLVVLDLYMPGLNGFGVLRNIRRPHSGLFPRPRTAHTVPVLVVSAESYPASIENARARGATAYLVKPIDLDHFQGVVQQLLC